MSSSSDQIDVIRNAQSGDQECQNQLADTARVRLYEYVYRVTLRDDVAEEVAQETVIEMFRVFHKLRRVESFWEWLYSIANRKLSNHRRLRNKHKAASLTEVEGDMADERGVDAVAQMIGQELKDVVMRSMAGLSTAQRTVLVMRCYRQMPYENIAESMGISKLAARSLFCRAKRSLARQLTRHGLGKSYLLPALILFGKLTASNKASAAGVSVQAASLKVGVIGGICSLATPKAAMLSAAATVAIAGGAVLVKHAAEPSTSLEQPAAPRSLIADPASVDSPGAERWFFYPEGPSGPVMMKLFGGRGDSECLCLQDQAAGYFRTGGTVTVRNHRFYNPDMSVMRLPTDEPRLSSFLSSMDGRAGIIDQCNADDRGLLVVCRHHEDAGDRIWHVERYSFVLDEMFVRYDWPATTMVDDQRDEMHKRGWTYFTLAGAIGGNRVSGAGRVAFSYAAMSRHWPWLRISIDGRVRYLDTGDRCFSYDSDGDIEGSYRGQCLFSGLSRPWVGLHTIDTIRRDAAEQRIPFETQLIEDGRKVRILVGRGLMRLNYVVDLQNDLVETITFEDYSGQAWKSLGVLAFHYSQQVGQAESELSEPRRNGGSGSARAMSGLLWLMNLADNQ